MNVEEKLQQKARIGMEISDIIEYSDEVEDWKKEANRKYVELDYVLSLVSEHFLKLQKLRKCVDAMFAAWSIKKIEVFDSETKETWIVTTLDPDNFQQFYDALDKFLVEFRELEKELKSHEG